MNKSLFAVLALTLVVSACKPQDTKNVEVKTPEPVMEKRVEEIAVKVPTPPKPSVAEIPTTKPTKVAADGSYTEYTPGVIGNGEESVLFFHATWCPKCKANDGRLKEYYGSAKYPRSVYKIDFDTSLDLKKQFGVTGQDTFIVIDGNGNEVERVRFPSSTALRDLLG
mgnify:CR=1 FL=1|jgi:thiol-disulfide isomerase/thioredoxin